MDWFVRAFLRASLAWLGLGVSLGVAMAVYPAWVVYRPAHLHMNLLGFVTMMIFGVAFHVIPRFTGRPLHNARLAGLQWWISNAGLALMVAGFALRAHGASGATRVLGTGGVLAALGAYAFIYNIWRTLGGATPLPARSRAPGKPLPTMP
ncbi:MAG: cbb3-type cytochrome c oxidase subunit I [Gemmatimonadota bacterium]